MATPSIPVRVCMLPLLLAMTFPPTLILPTRPCTPGVREHLHQKLHLVHGLPLCHRRRLIGGEQRAENMDNYEMDNVVREV